MDELVDTIEFYSCDGVFAKLMGLKKRGTAVPQHAHTYDHMTLLAHGAVSVWKNGVYSGEFHAPACINIEAKIKHAFVSVEDDTVLYCIHNVSRSGEVEIHEHHEFGDT